MVGSNSKIDCHTDQIRWYLRYALSYRDLEEMMRERGLSINHTTIYRGIQAYAPELEKRIRPHLRLTNDSYCVDETYVRIKGKRIAFGLLVAGFVGHC
jgi:transposase-like protein